jgi:hypothetical protein
MRAVVVTLAYCILLSCSAGYVSASQTAVDPAGTDPGTATQLQGPNDYLDTCAGPLEIPSLGIAVRDDRAKLEHGREVQGAVVNVSRTSAAADALESHRAFRYIKTGMLIGTVAATAVFPPAIFAVVILANSRIGESYDLIIGLTATA